MPEQAGHEGAVYVSGASVSATGEALSQLSGTTYIVDEITRRYIDVEESITVYENGSPTGQNYTINPMAGTVDFASSPTEPVTMDYNYRAKARVGIVRSWSYVRNRTRIDRTGIKLDGETDAGVKKCMSGLRDVNGTVAFLAFDEDILGDTPGSPDETFLEQLDDANKDEWFVLEINIADTKLLIAMVQLDSQEVPADIDEAIEASFTWNLAGPDDYTTYYYGDYQADI